MISPGCNLTPFTWYPDLYNLEQYLIVVRCCLLNSSSFVISNQPFCLQYLRASVIIFKFNVFVSIIYYSFILYLFIL